MAYTTRSNIEARYGKSNVLTWADLNNTGVDAEIDARVALAIVSVEALIDDCLRGGPYTLPLTVVGGTTPPTLIVDIAATLAGVWLYELRGVQDFNPETGAPAHRLSFNKKRAEMLLDRIRDGRVQLDAPKDDEGMAPEVIE